MTTLHAVVSAGFGFSETGRKKSAKALPEAHVSYQLIASALVFSDVLVVVDCCFLFTAGGEIERSSARARLRGSF